MTPTPIPLFEQTWPEGEFRFFQLGFVVDDLVETARRWATVFGVGPFHVMPRSAAVCDYRGAETSLDMQVAVAQAGPVQIELIAQFDDQPSIFRDVFARGEGGLHQLCTVTPDFDAKRAHLEAAGHPLVCEMASGRQRIGFFDTLADFGFVTEVAESTPSFLANLTNVSETCASWDGTDPVRLLTRDGYTTP